MVEGRFYFIKDEYFEDFPDDKLMNNKEFVNGIPHDRPCFLAFVDDSTGINWMIPISSQIEKFEKIYNRKIEKYGICDTIVFGNVLGYRKAFLIQNMCPITERYVDHAYIDSNHGTHVGVNSSLLNQIVEKAERVLLLQRHNQKLIFPDVLSIEAKLLRQLN